MTSRVSISFLSVLSVVSFITVTLACSCPPTTFQKLYNNADIIAKARVTKVRIIPASKSRFNAKEYRYKLRVLTVFKGCSLRVAKFIRARTVLDGGLCSSVLKKGLVVRLILPAGAIRRYNFFGCYDTKSWSAIKMKERKFLVKLRELVKRCQN